MDLNEIRKEIDVIDAEIVNLLNKRFDVVKKIAKFKSDNNFQILNKEREKDVVKKLLNLTTDYKLEVKNTYKAIMDISKSIQYGFIENDEIKSEVMITFSCSEDDLTYIIFKMGTAYNICNINMVTNNNIVTVHITIKDVYCKNDLLSFLSSIKNELIHLKIK